MLHASSFWGAVTVWSPGPVIAKVEKVPTSKGLDGRQCVIVLRELFASTYCPRCSNQMPMSARLQFTLVKKLLDNWRIKGLPSECQVFNGGSRCAVSSLHEAVAI